MIDDIADTAFCYAAVRPVLSDDGGSENGRYMDARPTGVKIHGHHEVNPPEAYIRHPSPASNSPKKCGRQTERDRQERYGTQPDVHNRQSTVAVREAAPEI